MEANNLDGELNESTPSAHVSTNNGDTNDNAIIPPEKGMTFSTWGKVEEMYKRYGKQTGFGITRWQGAKNSELIRRAMTWRCECWGTPDLKKIRERRKISKEMGIGGSSVVEKGNIRKRKSKKCGCEALVYAHLNAFNMWEIRNVVLEHKGHTPVPKDSRLVKEYRMQHFTPYLRMRLLNDVEVGVPINQIHDSLARERDGLENMPVTDKDMQHVADKERKLKLEGGDAMALMTYLDRMRRDNKDFYYSVRVDATGVLQDVFWVDARCKAAFEEFGDVVCFDTTYMTNDYLLPFANFVGVNHHGQTTLFGCELISHEDIETFTWVFRQWIMCMGDKAPAAILTDQAAAMIKPVAEVMPNTTHRWCIWHIMQKLPHKLGSMLKYDTFKKEFKHVIYNSFTPDEYEAGWLNLIALYGLQKNSWLCDLFDDRAMWVPAYMRDRFWAGMRTTQRVESIHSFFDKYVKAHTKLVEFGEKYTAAVEKRISQEKYADHRDTKWHRQPVTGWELEIFFSELYTDEKYLEYQQQCDRVRHGFVSEKKTIDDENIQYIIDDAVWIYKEGCRKDVMTNKRRFYHVLFNTVTNEGVCDCRLFETHGIMCRHYVCVLYQNHITAPPQKYVLDRWKKNLDRKHTRIKVAYHDPRRTNKVRRLDKMQNIFDVVTHRACVNDGRTSHVMNVLNQVLGELDGIGGEESDTNDTVEENDTAQGLDNIVTTPTVVGGDRDQSGVRAQPEPDGFSTPRVLNSNPFVTQTIRDPVCRKKRGRPKGSRMKSEVEKAIEKSSSTRRPKKKTNIVDEINEEETTSDEVSHDELGPSLEKKVTRSQVTVKQRKRRLAPLFDEELDKLSTYRRIRPYDDSSDESVSF